MIATAGLILGALASGQWASKYRRLAERPSAIWFSLLLVWMFVTAAWSDGNPASIAYAANVQWKLLIIPFMVMVIDSPRWLNRCWFALGSGLTVLLAHVVALNWVALPWVSSKSPSEVFFNPLPQSVSLALFCCGCLYLAVKWRNRPYRRAMVWSGFLIGTFAVFHLGAQRLGYLSWFVGCGFILLLTLSARVRWWALAGLIVCAVAIGSSSELVKGRIHQAYQDVIGYKFKNNYSSIGSRLHMWYVSAQAIRESPVIGRGLGSYPVLAEAAYNDPVMCEIGCKHPHNQYIFYTLEFGATGLFLFVAALLSAVRSLLASWKENIYPLTVMVVFIMCGLVESTLWYRGFFYLFVALLGLVVAMPSVSGSRNRLGRHND
jgi:O-antigen ligase